MMRSRTLYKIGVSLLVGIFWQVFFACPKDGSHLGLPLVVGGDACAYGIIEEVCKRRRSNGGAEVYEARIESF